MVSVNVFTLSWVEVSGVERIRAIKAREVRALSRNKKYLTPPGSKWCSTAKPSAEGVPQLVNIAID
jgi:hypothetical protein